MNTQIEKQRTNICRPHSQGSGFYLGLNLGTILFQLCGFRQIIGVFCVSISLALKSDC